MGYSIKALPRKKSTPQWRVQYASFKKADWPENTKAKARAKQLNAQAYLKRQEERIKKIADEQSKTQKRYDSVLPLEFVEEFELRFVQKKDSQTEEGTRKRSRAYTAWRAAQRMITAIGVEPSEWFYHTNDIYDYFYSQKSSLK